jgi:hypothetical protein
VGRKAELKRYRTGPVQDKSKKKHKSEKEKKSKKHDDDSGLRRSHSPHVEQPAAEVGDAIQREEHTRAPDAHASEWEDVFGRISQPKSRQVTIEKVDDVKPGDLQLLAPRLDSASDHKPNAGKVGDGGSSWRRKLQMRQKQQEGRLLGAQYTLRHRPARVTLTGIGVCRWHRWCQARLQRYGLEQTKGSTPS